MFWSVLLTLGDWCAEIKAPWKIFEAQRCFLLWESQLYFLLQLYNIEHLLFPDERMQTQLGFLVTDYFRLSSIVFSILEMKPCSRVIRLLRKIQRCSNINMNAIIFISVFERSESDHRKHFKKQSVFLHSQDIKTGVQLMWKSSFLGLGYAFVNKNSIYLQQKINL